MCVCACVPLLYLEPSAALRTDGMRLAVDRTCALKVRFLFLSSESITLATLSSLVLFGSHVNEPPTSFLLFPTAPPHATAACTPTVVVVVDAITATSVVVVVVDSTAADTNTTTYKSTVATGTASATSTTTASAVAAADFSFFFVVLFDSGVIRRRCHLLTDRETRRGISLLAAGQSEPTQAGRCIDSREDLNGVRHTIDVGVPTAKTDPIFVLFRSRNVWVRSRQKVAHIVSAEYRRSCEVLTTRTGIRKPGGQ